MTCPQCNDTKWYTPEGQIGTIHSYHCHACCTHDKGKWLLEKHYGKDNGKWCCLNGCGKMWETETFSPVAKVVYGITE